MRKYIGTLLLVLALAACTSGRVLSRDEASELPAATLLADPGVILRISPLYHPELETKVEVGDPLSLSLTSGWFKVAFACDIPTCGPDAGAIMIREYTTERNIRVE